MLLAPYKDNEIILTEFLIVEKNAFITNSTHRENRHMNEPQIQLPKNPRSRSFTDHPIPAVRTMHIGSFIR